MAATKKKTTKKVAEKKVEPQTPEPEVVEEQPQGFDPNKDTKLSILVGLQNDDNFMFEIFGNEKTVSNLDGVVEYFSRRIQQEKNKRYQSGDFLTMELAKLVIELTKKVDHLISLSSKKDNEL